MEKVDGYRRTQWIGFGLFLAGMLLWLFGKTLGRKLFLPATTVQDFAERAQSTYTAFTILTILLIATGIGLFCYGAWVDKKRNPGRVEPSPFLKLWVWAHVVMISIKCLPAAPKRAPVGTEFLLVAADKIKPALDFYLWPTGFWQGWEMFAPNPSDWEGYVTAEVFFKDGSQITYQYPRMYDLGLGIKYVKERYRKFLERAQSDDAAFLFLRPRFALRVAYECYKDPNNPPVKVQLWRHSFIVPPTITFQEYLSDAWASIASGRFDMSKLLPENPPMPPYGHYLYFTAKFVEGRAYGSGKSEGAVLIPMNKLKEMAGY